MDRGSLVWNGKGGCIYLFYLLCLHLDTKILTSFAILFVRIEKKIDSTGGVILICDRVEIVLQL